MRSESQRARKSCHLCRGGVYKNAVDEKNSIEMDSNVVEPVDRIDEEVGSRVKPSDSKVVP